MDAPILTLNNDDWHVDKADGVNAIEAPESGKVLHFPNLAFSLSEEERDLLSPSLVDPKRKNISFNINKKQLNGVASPEHEKAVQAILQRYYDSVSQLVNAFLPAYGTGLKEPVNSLRVHDISQWQGKVSWRKDDKRLHIDAFPSRPMQGNRILRIFNNINPHGQPRSWRVGEPFEDLASRMLPQLKSYSPLSALLQEKLKITKSRRTHYDHIMLAMHDAMKADESYQKSGKQWAVDFFPGSTWMCYSDQVPHAAMKGQYMLEQTYVVDKDVLQMPELSPLKQLECLMGQALI